MELNFAIAASLWLMIIVPWNRNDIFSDLVTFFVRDTVIEIISIQKDAAPHLISVLPEPDFFLTWLGADSQLVKMLLKLHVSKLNESHRWFLISLSR